MGTRGAFGVIIGEQEKIAYKAEDTENYIAHLEWCHENDRKPFRKRRAEYKAIEMIASWPLHGLPDTHDFLAACGREELEEAVA